jgi:hypothetical protein
MNLCRRFEFISATLAGSESALIKAILTDPQFWIPVAVLGIGITLLACLR